MYVFLETIPVATNQILAASYYPLIRICWRIKQLLWMSRHNDYFGPVIDNKNQKWVTIELDNYRYATKQYVALSSKSSVGDAAILFKAAFHDQTRPVWSAVIERNPRKECLNHISCCLSVTAAINDHAHNRFGTNSLNNQFHLVRNEPEWWHHR